MTILDHEALIRLAAFAGVLLAMALWEIAAPRRGRVQPTRKRWVTNFSIVALDTLALRVLFPILAVGVAIEAESRGWGLFSLLDWPFWLEVLIAVVLLDMAIYWQHVASHKIPLLWAIHRVHHADRDVDVTTGIRFHPIEICLSMLYKFVVIIALGAPAVGVFLFEVLLNATSMFNHANIRLPAMVDRLVRLVVVTPDMHRVHHSVHMRETDSNYGFNLSVWDRLFGTYIPQPRDGHEAMRLGLLDHQSDDPSTLVWSLRFPFVRPMRSRTRAVPAPLDPLKQRER